MLVSHSKLVARIPAATHIVFPNADHLSILKESAVVQERGLAVTTVTKYVRAARSFLIQQRITNVRALSRLSAQRVIRFVQSKCAGRSRAARVQHLAIGLRSFLRYCRMNAPVSASLPRRLLRAWTEDRASWSLDRPAPNCVPRR